MTASVGARLLVLAYPPSFRARYGAGLEAVVEETGVGGRVVLDLLYGALRAWVVPTYVTGDTSERRRWRLEASVSTLFVCWCIALGAVGVFSRAVADKPVPGLDGGVAGAAYRVAETAFTLSTVVLAAGLLFYAAAALVPAVRGHRREVWMPMAITVGATTAWAAAGLFVGRLVQLTVHAGGAPPASVVVVVLGWLAIGALCAAGCMVAAPLALRRSALPTRLLTPGVAGGAVMGALTTVAAVAASVCMVALMQRPQVVVTVVPGFGAALVLVCVSVVAVTSAARGLRAPRSL